jgi:hypothetical protein
VAVNDSREVDVRDALGKHNALAFTVAAAVAQRERVGLSAALALF